MQHDKNYSKLWKLSKNNNFLFSLSRILMTYTAASQMVKMFWLHFTACLWHTWTVFLLPSLTNFPSSC